MFKPSWRMLFVMVLAGMIVGLLSAAVVTYFMPRVYESYTEIWAPKQYLIPDDFEQNINPASTSHNMIGGELDKIKGRNSLKNVIERLGLLQKWNMDEGTALMTLRDSVTWENIRETDAIRITVRSRDPKEARDIAAELVNNYRNYRGELIAQRTKKGISELKHTIRMQEEEVEQRKSKLAKIIHKAGPGNISDPTDVQEVADAKRDFVAELALLEQMKLKLAEELTKGLPSDIVVVYKDPVIADSPVSPNVALNLVAGAGGGILISPFLALPLMWWMNRRNR
jgi:uncharacterized protein involved in exopolysaccharide biosynthesis